MFFFIKNNPTKLYLEFDQVDSYKKRFIVDRLIELKATSELRKLLNRGYNNIIIQFLVKNYSDDPIKLVELYKSIDDSHNLITKQLLIIKAYKELDNILKSDYNPEIAEELISHDKLSKDTLSSISLKKNLIDEVIDTLIKYQRNNLLEDLMLDSFNKRIFDYFLKNKIIVSNNISNLIDNPNFETDQINDMIDILIENSEVVMLNKLLLKKYNARIFYYLLNDNSLDFSNLPGLIEKTDIEGIKYIAREMRYKKLFSELNSLLLIKFNEEIFKSLIFEDALEYKFYEKHLTSDKIQLKTITHILFSNNYRSEITKLIDQGHTELVFNSILDFDESEITGFLTTFINSCNDNSITSVLDLIFEKFDKDTIVSLINSNYKHLIVEKLAVINKNDIDFLIKLFDIIKYPHNKILEILTASTAIEQINYIINQCNSNNMDHSIYIPLFVNISYDKPDELIKLYGKDSESDSKIIDRFIELKCENELKSLVNSSHKYEIFSKCKDYLFSNEEILDNVINDFENIEIVEDDEQNYYSILFFLNKLEMKELDNLFVIIFDNYDVFLNIGLRKYSKSIILVSFILNLERFKEYINKNATKFKIIEDTSSLVNQIEEEYASKIMDAQSKDEIKKLINLKNSELNSLISQEAYSYATNICFFNLVNLDINTKQLKECDKIKFSDYKYRDFKLVDNFNEVKKTIDKRLKEELKGKNDIKEIETIKYKYEKELSKYISKDDLLYSLQSLEKIEVGDYSTFSALEYFYEKVEDEEVKNYILYRASFSERFIDSYEFFEKNTRNMHYCFPALLNFHTPEVSLKFLSRKKPSSYCAMVIDLNDENDVDNIFSVSPKGDLMAYSLYQENLIKVIKFDKSGFSLKYEEILSFDNNKYESWRNRALGLAISYDSKYIGIASQDTYAKIIRIEDGEEVYVSDRYPSWTWSVAFSPDGKYFAYGTGSWKAVIVRLSDFHVIKTIQHPDYHPVYALEFSPDSKILATSCQYTEDPGDELNLVRLFSTDTFEEICYVKDVRRINSISFTNDGKYLVYGIEGGTVARLDLFSFEVKRSVSKFYNKTADIDTSNDSKFVVTCNNNYITFLDIENMEFWHQDLFEGNIKKLAFSFIPDSEYLCVGTTIQLLFLRVNKLNNKIDYKLVILLLLRIYLNPKDCDYNKLLQSRYISMGLEFLDRYKRDTKGFILNDFIQKVIKKVELTQNINEDQNQEK